MLIPNQTLRFSFGISQNGHFRAKVGFYVETCVSAFTTYQLIRKVKLFPQIILELYQIFKVTFTAS